MNNRIFIFYIDTNILILRNTAAGSDSKFFYQTWNNYQQGFGTLDSLYWIGLDKLHDLSQSGCAVQFNFQAVSGTCYYAQYSTFVVGGSAENYTLNIGGLSGNTFDAMIWNHNNLQFSTYDYGPEALHCSVPLDSGWWYGNGACCTACLTVFPSSHLSWWGRNSGQYFFLKEVEIRFVC